MYFPLPTSNFYLRWAIRVLFSPALMKFVLISFNFNQIYFPFQLSWIPFWCSLLLKKLIQFWENSQMFLVVWILNCTQIHMVIYTHVQCSILSVQCKYSCTCICWFYLTEVDTYELLPSFCTFMNHVFRNNTFYNFRPVGEFTVKLIKSN